MKLYSFPGAPNPRRALIFAAEKGIEMSKEAGRETFYGMPYDDWKAGFQSEASAGKQAAFKIAFEENVGKDG